MKIEVIYNVDNKNQGHKDISVIIPLINVCESVDSYYFVLDRSFMVDEETSDKVAKSLVKNLKYWIEAVTQMKEGDTSYFPFDLSDEYVGFLIVDQEDCMIKIRYGVSREVTGWSLNAYRPEEFSLTKPIDYIGDDELLISKNEFIDDVEKSIERIQRGW